jgi:hypothetical protein
VAYGLNAAIAQLEDWGLLGGRLDRGTGAAQSRA